MEVLDKMETELFDNIESELKDILLTNFRVNYLNKSLDFSYIKTVFESTRKYEEIWGLFLKTQSKISELKVQLNETETNLNQANINITNLNNIITGFEQSNSWRITRPLRNLNRLLKNLTFRKKEY